MPETPSSSFRIKPVARRRLKAMAAETGKSERELLELAITHLRATLLAGQGVMMTIPNEPDDSPKGHKKARRAA